VGVGRASNHAEFFPLPLAPSRLGEGGNKKTYPRKLPTSPRWGEASETVWSPTLLAFLIDDNV